MEVDSGYARVEKAPRPAFMKIDETPALRKTITACPECGAELPGRIVRQGREILLNRECPEHGVCNFPLSHNGDSYADLDRFYFQALKGTQTRGRIANYWVLSTPECQMKCAYCQTGIIDPFFEEMTVDDFRYLFDRYGQSKLTLSGGEPTMHPHIFEYFLEASKRGLTTELATNGVKLASTDYCRRLIDAHVKEVRVSLDSLNAQQAAAVGAEEFVSPKLEALRNLRRLNVATVLSPTIFKGVNEDQLEEVIQFAAENPFVKAVSVNGFSWAGEGKAFDRDRMIMPDEMMDIIHRRFFKCDREDIFTLQKFLYTALHLVGVRLCFYTQIIFFVRDRGKLVPLTDFLHIERMKKSMILWERFSKSCYAVQCAALIFAAVGSLRWKTLRIIGPLLRTLFANISKLNVAAYPKTLLPVVLNTNCSLLCADNLVGLQCMSGILFRQDGRIVEDSCSHALIKSDRAAVGAHRRREDDSAGADG